MEISPYLGFNGQCEEAFRFYEKVLGGKIEGIVTYGGSPVAAQCLRKCATKSSMSGCSSAIRC